MTEITKLVLILLTIGIGLNLSANNGVISLLESYVFYRDKTATKMIRPIGLLMAFSSILFLMDMALYGLLINIIFLLIISFFSISGRSRAYNEKAAERERIMKEYQEEILEKKKKLEQLRNKHKESKEPKIGEGKSVAQIRKEMWDDGSLTNRDIVKGLNKDS